MSNFIARNIRSFFLAALVLWALFFNAQEKTVRFTTKIEKGGKPCGGATAVITQNGKPFQTIVVNDDGKLKVDLPLGFNYQISIGKPQLCTKKLEISTVGVPADGSNYSFEIAGITLFELQKGIDYSVLNQVLVKAAYSPSIKNIDYDENYVNQMLGELEKLKQLERDAIQKEKEKEANYQNAIKNADKSFQKKEWQGALSFYEQASTIKPEENYPKEQIEHIKKLIAEADAKAKAEAEAKAKAEAEAAAKKKAEEEAARKKAEEEAAKRKELNDKYNAAIKRGDDAFAAKNWENAKIAYNDAIVLKATESYPKDQLKKIDEAIAKELADKKAAEDAAAAKAAKEKELNDKYNAAIKKGDEAFTAKKWDNAKAAYNEALGLKPAETYPKEQLKKIEDILAKEAADKKAAEEAAAKEKEQNDKYNAAIKKGDEAFFAKNWDNAKTAYNEALSIKPAEAYPKEQLKKIDAALAKELADKKAAEEAAAKAKAAEEAAKLKAAEEAAKQAKENELNEKYNAAVKKGDEGFVAKNWDNAKSAYKEALVYKPKETYPKDQLKKIDEAIAKELSDKKAAEAAAAKAKAEEEAAAKAKAAEEAAAKKKAEEEAAAKAKAAEEAAAKAKAESEAKYKLLISTADKTLAKKEYESAKGYYEQALAIKPEEKYPKDKIAEIDKILKEIAKQKEIKDKNNSTILPTLGGKKTETTNPSDPLAKYNEAIKQADAFFSDKKYKDAKKFYQEALVHKNGDAYAKIRMVECEKLINADNAQMINQRKKELLAKYKPGVTEETITASNVTIVQRVLVRDGDVWVYQKKMFNWGGISYFRDDVPITESIFEQETTK